MSDEIELAESTADAIKGLGLRKYLWLYFIVVPLAAATASVVAIGIAALQGLSDHPMAMQIYALILLACGKAIGVLGVGYGAGVLLAMLTSVIRDRTISVSTSITPGIGLEPVARALLRAGAIVDRALDRFFPQMVINLNASDRVMLMLSVAYGALIVAGGLVVFVLPDILKVTAILELIAAPIA